MTVSVSWTISDSKNVTPAAEVVLFTTSAAGANVEGSAAVYVVSCRSIDDILLRELANLYAVHD